MGCTITVEVHLGLNAVQERQLFHDLNNLGKKPEAALNFRYDTSNPVNMYIKEVLHDESVLKAAIAEKDVIDWHKDEGVIGRKDLIAINALLFLNKTNIAGASPSDVVEKKEIATRFWEAVSAIPCFGGQGKKEAVAAQPVTLKAIAKLTYDFAFGKHKSEASLNNLLNNLGKVSFSHANPMWRCYEVDAEERGRELPGLSEYLPRSDDGANRDVGKLDNVTV